MLILIAVLVIAGLWLFFGISAVFSAERDLLARLDTLAKYYVSMDEEYVIPLQTIPALPDDNRKMLQGISEKLKTLAVSRGPKEQLENLLLVQRGMLAFFAGAGLPEEFTANVKYADWNKNATNQGQASKLVYEYNVALSIYNARLRTPVGKIAGSMHMLAHRSYLGIDGTVQNQTRISF